MRARESEITYRPSEHRDKYEAIARISSLLAHKINNPLTVMTNYLFLLKQSSQGDNNALGMLGNIEEGVHRTRDIMHEFVDASRPCTGRREKIPIDDLISEAISCLRAGIGGVAFSLELPEGQRIRAEREGLVSALSIIITNAVESGTGKVIISSEQDQRRSVIRVRDFGRGIPPENISHVFEPFFTTLEAHLGLGLYRAYHIVQSLGGSIWCRSWDSGSEFVIELL